MRSRPFAYAVGALLVATTAFADPLAEPICPPGKSEEAKFHWPASGQTMSYGPGSDGDVHAGAALSYRDNGDGTISDLNTGLMWEKKDDFDNSDVSCNSPELCPNPHDSDNRYVWNATAEGFTGPLAKVFLEQLNNRCGNDVSVACKNDAECGAAGGKCGFGGYRDWRIPTLKELQTIVNYDGMAPSIDAVFNHGCTSTCSIKDCSCTVPNVHWTSTTHPADATWAGYVSFYDGNIYADVKSHGFYVRAVRGPSGCSIKAIPATGQTQTYGAGSDGDLQAGAALRYRDNRDGTATDLNTGLMWELKQNYDNALVSCTTADACPDPHDADNCYSWGSGENFDGTLVTVFLDQLNHRCANDQTRSCKSDSECGADGHCGFAGHHDWRIPNWKELYSLVKSQPRVPPIDEVFHRSCDGDCKLPACSCTAPKNYWTSSTYQGDPTWAGFVGFYDGNLFADKKEQFFYARAVRDADSPPPATAGERRAVAE